MIYILRATSNYDTEVERESQETTTPMVTVSRQRTIMKPRAQAGVTVVETTKDSTAPLPAAPLLAPDEEKSAECGGCGVELHATQTQVKCSKCAKQCHASCYDEIYKICISCNSTVATAEAIVCCVCGENAEGAKSVCNLCRKPVCSKTTCYLNKFCTSCTSKRGSEVLQVIFRGIFSVFLV